MSSTWRVPSRPAITTGTRYSQKSGFGMKRFRSLPRMQDTRPASRTSTTLNGLRPVTPSMLCGKR